MQARTITPGITVADQPDEADLASLNSDGYAAVVNLRNLGEPEQPISPEDEGAKGRNLGLDYLHHGIGGNRPLADQGVDVVLQFLEKHADARVLVHCRKGGRAAALVLIQQAKAHGWSASEALEKGRAMGLNVEGGLQALVEQFLAYP